MPPLRTNAFLTAMLRPRGMLWVGVVVLILIAAVTVSLGVTSTYWFCADACHAVQDDTITAYNASSHAKISCMACHMPVGAGPLTFTLHKAAALGELYLTVTGSFELPLNAHSDVAMEMDDIQCAQCHGANRRVTPSPGIIIDHEVHKASGVSCTTCHNRIAHVEEFELKLKGNRKHDDFMTMTACFRCHTQDGISPPGKCPACHTSNFNLKPQSHNQPGFYDKGGESAGHAELAQSREATGDVESQDRAAKKPLARLSEIDYCGTCHAAQFCSDCHGLPMPHPTEFLDGHGPAGRSKPAVCSTCHARNGTPDGASSAEFCNGCHHKGSDPNQKWISQHWRAVEDRGASACFECHVSTYCAECHVKGL